MLAEVPFGSQCSARGRVRFWDVVRWTLIADRCVSIRDSSHLVAQDGCWSRTSRFGLVTEYSISDLGVRVCLCVWVDG